MEKKLGQMIKDARVKFNLSRGEFSRLSGISVTALYNLEHETTQAPHFNTVLVIYKTIQTLETNDFTIESPEPDNSKLGELIKKTRSKFKISRNEFADLSNLSLPEIYNLEHGIVHNPHDSTVALIYDAIEKLESNS